MSPRSALLFRYHIATTVHTSTITLRNYNRTIAAPYNTCSLGILPTMRTSLLAAVLTPTLILAAPPTPPHITNLQFSGTGCPNDSGSVKSSTGTLGDTASFTFSQLKGSDTDNCQLHIISSGATQGWQVAVKAVTYDGNVKLKSGSALDVVSSVFWSENAGATVRNSSSIAQLPSRCEEWRILGWRAIGDDDRYANMFNRAQ